MSITKQKISKASAKRFMAQVMEPLPDTELQDKELARLEARAKKEARRRHDERFYKAHMRTKAAYFLHNHYQMLRVASDKRYRRGADAQEKAELIAEIRELMKIPSTLARHVSVKRDFMKFDHREKEFAPYVEADVKRLGCK